MQKILLILSIKPFYYDNYSLHKYSDFSENMFYSFFEKAETSKFFKQVNISNNHINLYQGKF